MGYNYLYSDIGLESLMIKGCKRGLVGAMSQPRNTTGKGYFAVRGDEPLAKRAIAVRLPESIDIKLRETVGNDLSDWLRQTIIEKLESETSQTA